MNQPTTRLIFTAIASTSLALISLGLVDQSAHSASCHSPMPTAGNATVGCSTEGSGGSSKPPQRKSPGRQRSAPKKQAPQSSTGVSEPDPCVTPVYGDIGWLLCFIPDEVPQQAAAPSITPEQAAQHALASLQLPEPSVTYTPSPRVNPWGKHFIGVPYRYVVTGVSAQSLTHSEQGITIEMTTTDPVITIDHGDGTIQQCSTTHACTHRYQDPGTYITTVTAHWSITWAALGQSGTITTTTTSSSPPTRYHEIHTLLTEPKQN